MKKGALFLFLFLISSEQIFCSSLLYAKSDLLPCEKSDRIAMNYHVDYGVPRYKLIDSESFPKTNPSYDGYTIKGLTDISYKRSYDIKVGIRSFGSRACLFLAGVDVYFGFKDIDVLIDNKYPINSCEYSVIKNHENKHVKTYQRLLKRYSSSIGAIIYNRVKEMEPIVIDNPSSIDTATEEYVQSVKDFILSDPSLNNVEGEMLYEIEIQNNLLDSKEEYDMTRGYCSNW